MEKETALELSGAEQPKKKKKLKSFDKKNGQLIWWLMLLPGLIFTLIFRYGPMFGVIISFQEFGLGSTSFFGNEWVGFDNFTYAFQLKAFGQSIVNTLIIAGSKTVLGIVVPLILALLINEVGSKWFAKIVISPEEVTIFNKSTSPWK